MGIVRESAARLYDVDEPTVVVKKFDQAGRYDTGTVTFAAKPGTLIDLDKLYESLWASRLSRGTRSGLVSFEVTAVGEVVADGEQTVLHVAGTDARFVLAGHPDEGRAAFDKLRRGADENEGNRLVRVTGRLDGWAGRWPDVLRTRPSRPHRILVTEVEMVKNP